MCMQHAQDVPCSISVYGEYDAHTMCMCIMFLYDYIGNIVLFYVYKKCTKSVHFTHTM